MAIKIPVTIANSFALNQLASKQNKKGQIYFLVGWLKVGKHIFWKWNQNVNYSNKK